MKDPLEVIFTETAEIEYEAAIAATAHYRSGRTWAQVNLMLGIPTSMLAAISGVSAVTEQNIYLTGGMAILVACLTSINTFLNPGEALNSHRKAKTIYDNIRREASLLKDVDVLLAKTGGQDRTQELVDSLRGLANRLGSADQESPSVFARALKIAKKNHIAAKRNPLPTDEKR